MRKRAHWLLSICAVLTVWTRPAAWAQQSEVQPQHDEETIIEACAGPEHRQFDFWVGEWEVSDAAGQLAGTNEIARVANGCGLSEYWRGAGGRNGTSLNWYDPGSRQWHQVWVGLGLYLHLRGGLEGERMVLAGERVTLEGTVIDRISWMPLEPGRVRQLWEVSRDGGKNWQVVFDGTYKKR